jgi:hypothetical protein
VLSVLGGGFQEDSDLGPFFDGVMGQGAEGGELFVGQSAGEAGALGDGFDDIVGTDAVFDNAGGDAVVVVEAADLIAEALDAGTDLDGVFAGEGDLLAIELYGFGGDAIGDFAVRVFGDADESGEAEVGFTEFVETANDGLGGAAADAGVLGTELFPIEAEGFIAAGVVDLLETDGLAVAALGGDPGERLLAAGPKGGLENGILFHSVKV